MNTPKDIFSRAFALQKSGKSEIKKINQEIRRKESEFYKISNEIKNLNLRKQALAKDIVVFEKDTNISISVIYKEITNYESVPSSKIYANKNAYKYTARKKTIVINKVILYFSKNSIDKKYWDTSSFYIVLFSENTLFQKFRLDYNFSLLSYDSKNKHLFTIVKIGNEQIKKDVDFTNCIKYLKNKAKK